MLILSFLILCASFSLSLLLGSRIAVRMLLALPLRECDGVSGLIDCSSCFFERLNLRFGALGSAGSGFAEAGRKG